MKKIGGEKNLISKETIGASKPSNVHIYEIQPYTFTSILKRPNGEIFQIQNLKKDKNTYKVIYNGLTTIAILSDGTKGISRCNPADRYIRQIGHDIAVYRAKIKQLEKDIESLFKEGRA